MPRGVDRLTRVNELLKRELANRIERLSFRNPGMLVSVSEVSANVELRNARVGISFLGGTECDHEEAMRELQRNRPEFQHEIAKTLGFKRTPVLDFRIDRRLELGDRVFAILNEPETKDDGSEDK